MTRICAACHRATRHKARGLCSPCYLRAWRIQHLPPALDVDEIVVARLMSGEEADANKAERAEAIRQMTRAGQSAATIAALVGVAERTVTRYRRRDAA